MALSAAEAPILAYNCSSTPLRGRTQSCIITPVAISENKQFQQVMHLQESQAEHGYPSPSDADKENASITPLPVHHLHLHSPPRFSLQTQYHHQNPFNSLSIPFSSSIHDEVKLGVVQLADETDGERSFWQSPYKHPSAYRLSVPRQHQHPSKCSPASPPPPQFHLNLDPPIGTIPISQAAHDSDTLENLQTKNRQMDKSYEESLESQEDEKRHVNDQRQAKSKLMNKPRRALSCYTSTESAAVFHHLKPNANFLNQTKSAGQIYSDDVDLKPAKKGTSNWVRTLWKSMKTGKYSSKAQNTTSMLPTGTAI